MMLLMIKIDGYTNILLYETFIGFGLEDVTEILIKNGALVNMIDNTGRTAFHHCAEMNQISTAKLLVRNKANTR